MKRCATVVDKSNPAVEVGGFIVAGHGENVVGVPGKIGGEVGSFNLLLARARVLERHEQGGTVVEIGRDFRKAVGVGVRASDDVVTDFPDLAVVVGKQSGFDFFVFGGAVVHVRADEGDFFADVLVEELGRFEEVVFVILFDDAELVGVGQRAEMDGGGIDGGGDVHEFETESAIGEIEIADVANQSDVGIVDGDVEIGLVVEAGGLIVGGGAGRFFFLRGEDGLAAARGIEISEACEEKRAS